MSSQTSFTYKAILTKDMAVNCLTQAAMDETGCIPLPVARLFLPNSFYVLELFIQPS
jgi:hypothetical protein